MTRQKTFIWIALVCLVKLWSIDASADGDVWLDGRQVVNADHLTLDVDLTLTGGGRIVTTANGDIQLLPNGTGITKIGDSCSTSHSLSTNDDGLICGQLEIDGSLFLDSGLSSDLSLTSAGLGIKGVNVNSGIIVPYSSTQTNNDIALLTGTNNVVLIGEYADVSTDFGHAQQTNPTIIGHSADATDTTQWWSLTHDQTDHVQGIGSGNKVTHHEAPVSVADDASFTLPDASTGFGTFIIGDAQEHAVISWTSAGAVTILDSTANVVTTDTDANLCFIDGGTQVSIKNRLGLELEVMFDYHYME